ncbi:unnamed protein product [Closterium sp. NIES-64]|nr:unnamed protein product [Closterium sp. NIES-64]
MRTLPVDDRNSSQSHREPLPDTQGRDSFDRLIDMMIALSEKVQTMSNQLEEVRRSVSAGEREVAKPATENLGAIPDIPTASEAASAAQSPSLPPTKGVDSGHKTKGKKPKQKKKKKKPKPRASPSPSTATAPAAPAVPTSTPKPSGEASPPAVALVPNRLFRSRKEVEDHAKRKNGCANRDAQREDQLRDRKRTVSSTPEGCAAVADEAEYWANFEAIDWSPILGEEAAMLPTLRKVPFKCRGLATACLRPILEKLRQDGDHKPAGTLLGLFPQLCLSTAALSKRLPSLEAEALIAADLAPTTDETRKSLEEKHPRPTVPFTAEDGSCTLPHPEKPTKQAARGDVGQGVAQWWTSSSLVALEKPGGGVRPIAVGEVFPRLLARCLAVDYHDAIIRHLKPKGQFGAGARNGAETVIHGVRAALKANPTWGVLQIDVKNAFNSVCRQALFKELVKGPFVGMTPFLRTLYGSPSPLLYRADATRHTLWSRTGVRQGDPLGPFLYALAQQPALEAVKAAHRDVFLCSYADDTYLLGELDAIGAAFPSLCKELQGIDLEVSQKKCQWYAPSGKRPSADNPLCEMTEAAEGLVILNDDSLLNPGKVNKAAQTQITLPERMGGFGVQSAARTADLARRWRIRLFFGGKPIPDVVSLHTDSGKTWVMDVVIADPHDNNANCPETKPGAALNEAVRRKKVTYKEAVTKGGKRMEKTTKVIPLATEIYGGWSNSFSDCVKDIAATTSKRLGRQSGQTTDLKSLICRSIAQRIGVTQQRSQAVMIRHRLRAAVEAKGETMYQDAGRTFDWMGSQPPAPCDIVVGRVDF